MTDATIPTPRGHMPAYAAAPSREGPWPGVELDGSAVGSYHARAARPGIHQIYQDFLGTGRRENGAWRPRAPLRSTNRGCP